MNSITAVYIQVSTQEQRTDSQEQELRRYCRQRGWKDLRFYADKISGAKATRPELERLMQDIRAGAIQRLVVYKLDRLGRSLTHLALILDELNRLQVPLIASRIHNQPRSAPAPHDDSLIGRPGRDGNSISSGPA